MNTSPSFTRTDSGNIFLASSRRKSTSLYLVEKCPSRSLRAPESFPIVAACSDVEWFDCEAISSSSDENVASWYSRSVPFILSIMDKSNDVSEQYAYERIFHGGCCQFGIWNYFSVGHFQVFPFLIFIIFSSPGYKNQLLPFSR